MNAVIQYIFAVLAERHGIQLHALCVMSNHFHSVATDPEARIAEFQRDTHALIARHVNKLYGEFESLWSSEPTCRVECVSPTDLINKIIYTLCNPVQAGLVRHGRSWPGVRGSWLAKPLIVRRPPGFFRSDEEGGDWPEHAVLTFVRPPGFEHLSDADLADELSTAIAAREEELGQRARATGKGFVGRRGVRKQSRHNYPSSAEERFRLRPTVACQWKWARVEALQRKKEWEAAYASALVRLRSGERDVEFPYGTYRLRSDYRVACAPPPLS